MALSGFANSIGRLWLVALCFTIAAMTTASFAGDFPFDKELLLDAKPMKGSKRIPILDVGRNGETIIDLWCNSVEAQIVVVGNTISIMTGTKSAKQCDPARMQGDDDLLASLLQATTWRHDGAVLTLSGGKTLRFRTATN